MSNSSAAKNSIETQQIDGFDIIGPTIVTCNESGDAAGDINRLWQDFFEGDMLHKIRGRADNVLYAVYSDYEGDHTKPYRVTLGCRTERGSPVPEGMQQVFVPGGDYAIFAARGEQPAALISTWEGIWKSNLPRSYKADVEIYGPRFFEEGIHEVLVCVGVKV